NICGFPGILHNPEFERFRIFSVSPLADAIMGIPQAIYDCSFAGIVILNIGLSDKVKSAASLAAKNSGILSGGCFGIKLNISSTLYSLILDIKVSLYLPSPMILNRTWLL